MNEFNIAVAKSVQSNKNLKDIGDCKYYFDKNYLERIKTYLIDIKKIDSKETSKQSLRSASSSARLCTNYFYDDNNVELEKPIYNDVSSTPTKMDAVDGLIFYECKCQEVVEGENEKIRKSYYIKTSSKLFKEFGIKNIKIENHYKKDGTNDYDFCDFYLEDIGISIPSKKYYEINFNLKQLICHLIAIAHSYSDKDKKTLKYSIFKPANKYIEQSPGMVRLYQMLDEQFSAILDSKNISQFLKTHNILLDKEYVYIDQVAEHFN